MNYLGFVLCGGGWIRSHLLGCLIVGFWGVASGISASEQSEPLPAARITRAAVDAGIAGKLDKRQRMLQVALALEPDYAPARWEAGYLNVDGNWLSVEETQAAARNDARLERYAELRQTLADTPADHLRAAEWCREQGLHDEARFHWMRVLAAEPQHAGALAALQLTWHDGQLVRRDQVDAVQQQTRRQRDADRRWKRAIVRWEHGLTPAEGTTSETLEDLRQTVDETAIPEFERLAASKLPASAQKAMGREQLCLAFVDALARMEGFRATESLVRHAMFAASESVRTAASAKLKDRPLHGTVPLLLSYLASPIESRFNVHVDSSGGVNYWHELYTEGPIANYAVEFGATQHATARIVATWGRRVTDTKLRQVFDLAQGRVQSHTERGAHAAFVAGARLHESIDAVNLRRSRMSERAAAVLEDLTGQQFGSDLQAWWKYWLEHNEYDYPEEPPTYDQYATVRFHPIVSVCISCFVAGTPVWTKTGTKAVESLAPGELVLTRDVQTGELSYFPILATTTREPSEILRIYTSRGEIRTTLGHPFWVPGHGWRMAKELSTGDLIGSLEGPIPIQDIRPGQNEAAYNLVVDGPGNYFVGAEGLLVHDNTPRDPSTEFQAQR